jgi:hypothetical protein
MLLQAIIAIVEFLLSVEMMLFSEGVVIFAM